MTTTPALDDPRFLFVDIETTGLTNDAPGGLYRNGLVLEVGLTITGPDLRPIDSISRVVSYPRTVIDSIRTVVDPVVDAMHARSGLWAAVAAARLPPFGVESDLVRWAIGEHGVKPGTLPMCGSSVQTDREWLRERMPSLEALFHYRIVDVSSVKELVRRWFPPALWTAPPTKAHRALADLQDTIAELQHYRDTVFAPAGVPTR